MQHWRRGTLRWHGCLHQYKLQGSLRAWATSHPSMGGPQRELMFWLNMKNDTVPRPESQGEAGTLLWQVAAKEEEACNSPPFPASQKRLLLCRAAHEISHIDSRYFSYWLVERGGGVINCLMLLLAIAKPVSR